MFAKDFEKEINDPFVEVKIIIEAIPLPFPLPAEAFTIMGQTRKIPDFDLIINQLPAKLKDYFNLDASLLHSKQRSGANIYILSLKNEGYLRIKIAGGAIIELSPIAAPMF